MKRNFITSVAMMVAAFFVGTEIAHAADVSFSGSIRTRYENESKTDFELKDEAYDLIASQIRLNAKANINSDTSAFIQLQSAHTWGSANSSYTASDGDATVGIHQGYFTIKNFMGSGVAAKVGRQEVVLDGHRLFGHTGWTTGAQTHDAIRLTHGHGNALYNFAYMSGVEHTTTAGSDIDIATYVLHGNHQGVLGGALSTYLVFTDDDCGVNSNTCTVQSDNQWYTIGFRQAGKMFGLDYRAEYYYQTGAADGAGQQIAPGAVGETAGTTHSTVGYTDETSREAYMYGVRVGKAFSNLPMKPKVTLWYDYLSGNSDEDMNGGDWGAFDTHFDTGHKFYGFMDLFLNNTGSNTNFMGLQDIAIKLVLKPAPKWTLKADVHHFRTAESVGANPDMAMRTGLIPGGIGCTNGYQTSRDCGGNRGMNTEIGSEVDLTLVHALNANTKLQFGYSMFMAESLYHLLDGTSIANGWENQAHWAYVQARVGF